MYTKINEATLKIQSLCQKKPKIAIILGSGLGPLAHLVENPTVIDYQDIPHFPVSTIPGHAGQLILGTIEGCDVLVMSGRFHYYEGHDMETVTLPIRVFSKLGIENLIVTNAAGGLNDDYMPGDVAIIDDHFSFFAPSPLRGPNLDEFGPRFKDMTEVYSKRLSDLTERIAKKQGMPIKHGVYCFCQGPMFETPFEIRALKHLGVDLVGMSTVPEAIVARHCGMNTLGLSLITNKAAGLSNNELSHQEVMEAANKAEKQLVALVKEVIKEWDQA